MDREIVFISGKGDVQIFLLGGGSKKGKHVDIRLAQQRWLDDKTRSVR